MRVSVSCSLPTCSKYLEKEWALVLGLRAGRPEPVGQWSSLGCGDKVAQSHRLLQDVQSLLVGLHAVCTLTLQDSIDEMNEQSKTFGFNCPYNHCYLHPVYVCMTWILLSVPVFNGITGTQNKNCASHCKVVYPGAHLSVTINTIFQICSFIWY